MLAAENLFLRKQPAFYQERHVTPRRATDAARFILVWLARWFDWRQALGIVQPQTFTRWHRQGFCLFWRWKSRLGRPQIPTDLQALIRRMARENPLWGEERIANELLLKLGLLQADLREFEQKYHRASAEFYQQFQAGQIGDAMDYVEWASLMQMTDNLTKRLRLLGGEALG